VLILWLCMLCLIPFDICSMDSTLQTHTTTDQKPGSGDEKSSSLVTEIIEIARNFLKDPGPIRDAAAACLSSLLTRPDMDNQLLSCFFNYACSVTSSWTSKGDTASTEVASNSFEVIGVLQTIAQIFKKGERGRLLSNAPKILKECVTISSQVNQVKIRKLTVKLIQRIGMTFLPPRVAAWRYQRGKRSLSDNLSTANSTGGGKVKGALDGGDAQGKACLI
jgi:tubulin-specific chaperone D